MPSAFGNGSHIEFVNVPAGPYQYGHTVMQDEKIFHDNAVPKRGWRFKTFCLNDVASRDPHTATRNYKK